MRVYSTVYHVQDEDAGYQLQDKFGKPSSEIKNDVTVYDVHELHSPHTKLFLAKEASSNNIMTDHPKFNIENGLVLKMSDLEHLIDRLESYSNDEKIVAHIREIYQELDSIILRMIKNDAGTVWIY